MASIARPNVRKTTRHGTASLVAGFLAGLALFLAVGATLDDAVFSALALAVLVTVHRFVATQNRHT
jgi:membrane protein implicated in regulation of membrane protease activity